MAALITGRRSVDGEAQIDVLFEYLYNSWAVRILQSLGGMKAYSRIIYIYCPMQGSLRKSTQNL